MLLTITITTMLFFTFIFMSKFSNQVCATTTIVNSSTTGHIHISQLPQLQQLFFVMLIVGYCKLIIYSRVLMPPSPFPVYRQISLTPVVTRTDSSAQHKHKQGERPSSSFPTPSSDDHVLNQQVCCYGYVVDLPMTLSSSSFSTVV